MFRLLNISFQTKVKVRYISYKSCVSLSKHLLSMLRETVNILNKSESATLQLFIFCEKVLDKSIY